MPRTVELSDESFRSLQHLAEPIVDTVDTVVARLVEHAMKGTAYPLPGTTHAPQVAAASAAGPDRLQPDSHPNLRHTRLLSASFDAKALDRPSWNDLAKVAHSEARRRLGSYEELRKATRANIREGKYEEEGFVYFAQGDYSLQGMSSNTAWDNALRLAKAIGCGIEATFEWRDREGSAYPGRKATLCSP